MTGIEHDYGRDGQWAGWRVRMSGLVWRRFERLGTVRLARCDDLLRRRSPVAHHRGTSILLMHTVSSI